MPKRFGVTSFAAIIAALASLGTLGLSLISKYLDVVAHRAISPTISFVEVSSEEPVSAVRFNANGNAVRDEAEYIPSLGIVAVNHSDRMAYAVAVEITVFASKAGSGVLYDRVGSSLCSLGDLGPGERKISSNKFYFDETKLDVIQSMVDGGRQLEFKVVQYSSGVPVSLPDAVSDNRRHVQVANYTSDEWSLIAAALMFEAEYFESSARFNNFLER